MALSHLIAICDLLHFKSKLLLRWAVVVVKWSACFLSSPMIQVWIPWSLQSFCKILVDKSEKTKRGRGRPTEKVTDQICRCNAGISYIVRLKNARVNASFDIVENARVNASFVIVVRIQYRPGLNTDQRASDWWSVFALLIQTQKKTFFERLNVIYKLMRYEKWTQITNRYLYIKFNRSSWPNKVTTEVNNFPSMGN